jgi:GNAT superfamily N-acetyltransferase
VKRRRRPTSNSRRQATDTPEVVIAVAPTRRGEGIGDPLLDALIAKARDDGFAALSLGVAESNPAIRLYERHGFVRVETGGKRWTIRCDLSWEAAACYDQGDE